MVWHHYVDETDPSVEELANWLMSLSPFARKDLLARIEVLEERAAAGEIRIPADARQPKPLDAIRGDPDVYELRWNLYSKKVRQYHAEPEALPDGLVRLHLHIKADAARPRDGSAGARQQREIERAVERYHEGELDLWNVDRLHNS